MIRTFAVIAALTMTPALSASLDAADALYHKGQYQAARAEALALNTADGFALAARTHLGEFAYAPDPKVRARAIEDALALASKAATLEPNNLQARLQRAAAFGYKARQTKSISIAKQSKAEVEAALKIAPNDPEALVSMAVWHGEGRINGGSLGASLLGASADTAKVYFERALKAAPRHPAFPVMYASFLLRLDGLDEAKRARSLIDAALKLPEHSALGRLSQEHGRMILAALNAGDEDRVIEILKRTQPFRRP